MRFRLNANTENFVIALSRIVLCQSKPAAKKSNWPTRDMLNQRRIKRSRLCVSLSILVTHRSDH